MADRDVSLITGSSKGIGKAIALMLAKENHNVMLFGRDINALNEVQTQVKNLGVESELKKYGKIDHLINNAGIGILKKLVDSTQDEFKRQIDVNLIGVYNFTKCVVDNMIERKSGSIINIASLAGKNSFVGGTMYSATKHALLGFTRSLMLELRGYNIRVAAVCPGSVSTEFNPAHDPKRKILQADDVAETVSLILKLPPRALASEIDLRPTNPNG